MRFHALVGILPHERETRQPLEIDLTVAVMDGEGVVDYRALYDGVASIVNAGHIDFLEELGDRIASSVLNAHARAQHVRVATRKPHVALGGPLAYAEVVVERARDA